MPSRSPKLIGACAVLLAFAALARGWDTNAHKVIGVIAYRHLTLQAKAWCDKKLATLPEGYRDFLDAAPYPDYLKHGGPKDKPTVQRSRKFDGWHYIDYPVMAGQTDPVPYDRSIEGNGDNVIYGIGESIQSMTTGLESTRGLYLAMLIHLVGDVHQPLHCAERNGDKGGNGFPLSRGGIHDLHTLWDDALTVRFKMRSANAHSDEKIERVASEIEKDEPVSDPTISKEAEDLDPKHWAIESYKLAVDSAYNGIGSGETPSEAYETKWQGVAERRIALAGYRLANLLNKLSSPK